MASRSLSRRDFFAAWRRPDREAPPPAPQLPTFLRPPGALDERALLATCQHCGACREACPHDSIRPLGPPYGDAEGTPAILPEHRPCYLCDDLACTRVCPSGALRPIERSEVRMGVAELDPSRCWEAMGQPCDYCVDICPLPGRALRMGHRGPEVDPSACVGCGACQYICTTVPAAIRVVAVELDRAAHGEARHG